MIRRHAVAALPGLAAICPACLALANWLVACGSTPNGPAAGKDASADAASDARGDALADAGSDAPADAPEEVIAVGLVEFSEAPGGNGQFNAAFGDSTPTGATGCQIVDAGACTTTTCPPPSTGDGGPAGDAGEVADASFMPAPNPGRLTVSGGLFGAGTVLGPGKFGTYFYASPGPLFAPGDKLGVAAQGAEIPGFPTQTVTAPPTLQLTAPVSTDGGEITVVTPQALAVSWTGGQTGVEMVVTASVVFTTLGGASMTCSWDSSSGTATVPSAALRPLAAENAIQSGIVWYGLASTKVTTGPVALTITAYAPQGTMAAFQ